MPTRLIREGILSSERIEPLSWAEEVFYRRLLNVVDDFGRYYARPALLRSACYPLLTDRVSEADIALWLKACQRVGLLWPYTADDGKEYLALLDFRQQVRARSSKYPPPPSDFEQLAKQMRSKRSAVDKQLKASVYLDGDGDGDVDGIKEIPTPKTMQSNTAHASQMLSKRAADAKQIVSLAELEADGLAPETAADWLTHRKGKKAPLTHTAWNGIKREAARAHRSAEDACTTAMARGWTGFSASWLQADDERTAGNGRRDRETPYNRAARQTVEDFAPGVAAGRRTVEEAIDVADKSH